jgi:protease IV
MVDAAKILKEARDRRTSPLILELDLSEGLVEAPPPDALSALLSRRRSHLLDVLDGLHRARTDPRVRALVVKIGAHAPGFAATQELRDAVTAFRESGKLTVAWSETFGEFGRGTVPYYLATAFEHVYIQPSGDLSLTGVAIEQPFFRDALDKLGVQIRLDRRYEYKTAPNNALERSFTPEHRESMTRIAASVSGQIVAGIAAARGITESKVRELIDRAPLLGPEAVDEGLIDRLAYRDEVYADVRERVGADAQLRYIGRYQRMQGIGQVLRQQRQNDLIAIIHGNGAIRLGRSGRSPFPPGRSGAMGSDTVTAAFRAATRDRQVKAIVFRVDSPGGSYVASDAIWREVVLARRAGKPVVVSMGNVAASGGYFVAMAADAIVAQPGTLTGSIGVFGGKPVVEDLMGRLGVATDSVEEGAHSRMFSQTRDFTESEWRRVRDWLDRAYEDFTAKVAKGRDIDSDRVDELARGRVWTGADARERGLVDELGGLDTAVELARKKAGLPADAPTRPYPHVTPLERLRPAESSEDRTAASVRLEAWGPLARMATRLGLPAEGPLILPGSWQIR